MCRGNYFHLHCVHFTGWKTFTKTDIGRVKKVSHMCTSLSWQLIVWNVHKRNKHYHQQNSDLLNIICYVISVAASMRTTAVNSFYTAFVMLHRWVCTHTYHFSTYLVSSDHCKFLTSALLSSYLLCVCGHSTCNMKMPCRKQLTYNCNQLYTLECLTNIK